MVCRTFNAYTVKDGVTELAAAVQTNVAAAPISIAFIVFAMVFGVLQKKFNLEGKGRVLRRTWLHGCISCNRYGISS